MTEAEHLLWSRLRARQFAGQKFRKQVPIGPYVVDFFCWKAGLIVEVDGGQHDESVDGLRTRDLTKRGYRVVRFWNNDVLGNIDGVLEALGLILRGQDSIDEPSPYPLPRVGEGQNNRNSS